MSPRLLETIDRERLALGTALLIALVGASCLPEPPARSTDTGPPPTDSTTPLSDSTADASAEAGPDCPVAVRDAGTSGANRIRVVTFNLRRLFDSTCDTGSCGGDRFELAPSASEYDRRIEARATALAKTDADILLLQELETRAVFEDLRAALEDEGLTFAVAAFGETGWPASLDVGILARGSPDGDPMRYRDSRTLERPDGSTTKFTREFLGLPLEIGGEGVVVFTAHFKSKFEDDPGRRLAEARAARSIVDDIASDNPNALVVLAGDLNDTPESEALEALTDSGGLAPVAHRRSGDERWTYCYRGSREAIDHVLMARGCGGAYLAGSARRWGDANCPGGGGLDGSDHAALSADFALY